MMEAKRWKKPVKGLWKLNCDAIEGWQGLYSSFNLWLGRKYESLQQIERLLPWLVIFSLIDPSSFPTVKCYSYKKKNQMLDMYLPKGFGLMLCCYDWKIIWAFGWCWHEVLQWGIRDLKGVSRSCWPWFVTSGCIDVQEFTMATLNLKRQYCNVWN